MEYGFDLKMRRYCICFILAISFTITQYAYAGTKVEGRIFTQYGALTGATVSVFKTFADIESNKPILVAQPSDQEGVYRLSLSEGLYYFTATGQYEGKEHSAYYMNNPVILGSANVWLAMMVSQVKKPIYSPGETAIKGRVTFKGEPLKDAYITLYMSNDKVFKGLGFKTESVNEDGSFNIPVAPGKYVLVAKKYSGPKGGRPPQSGDLIGFYPANPVEVKEGQEVALEIPCYPKGDRSTFSNVPTVKNNDFTSFADLATSSGIGVKGRIMDTAGRPVKGIYVLAYLSETPVFQMYHLSHGTPYSARSDADGRYFIPLSTAGNYFVVVRDTLGDGPHRGEVYGLYQENPMHRIAFKAGDLVSGIDIVAGTTMAVTGQDDNKQAISSRLVDPLILSDTAILVDTVWTGKVIISGVVSIKRGVTLTIEPGTVVQFRYTDKDKNQIGDGEIMIEGRIIARGTPERRIVFTSAEANPKKRDWSYVNLIASGAPNLFAYCIFEYGFSGLQNHYANASVTDSLFRNNGEGLHFNTVNMDIEHNTFVQNEVGIKFSRLEGDVMVRNNLITDNDIGVLFVHQHINAVDFDNLHKVIEPPHFIQNNIFGNRKYNYSMGDRQQINIEMRDNWWGSVDLQAIATTIFDKEDDVELGTVVYKPILPAAVEAGVR
ncbi:MAG: hypothetical protein A2511_15100 [Deltaproteobacteria bacterium RIFOXYD12_FULL_50_9]|nr:MAG: hypothetical protein A2511_15100 [Deltaproteobacteria bacterium RIFOXYD12_FULL_50_9]